MAKTTLPITTATAISHNIIQRIGLDVPIIIEVDLPTFWKDILVRDDIPLTL